MVRLVARCAAFASVCAMALLSVACRERNTAASGEVRHVLLISIDTCRADHLGCYGFAKPTTPRLDAVAAQGTRYARTSSPVPMTLPAHCSLMTGTTPLVHGVHNNAGYRLGTSLPTMAELLGKAGFRTGAVIGAYVLDRQFGLDRGFDDYDDRLDDSRKAGEINERLGADVADRGIAWLKAHADEKTFLFLHFYDPHAPYTPPEEYAARFDGDLYAGEIAYADHCVDKVLDAVSELGMDDSTLLIILSDHGEMLGEHGESAHAYFIYQSAIHVPLIMRAPGSQQPAVVTAPTGLIDVLPTVCGYVDIPVPPEVEGRDLRLLPSAEADRAYYCESITPTRYDAHAYQGLVAQRWKYIQSSRAELYDLTVDPHEAHDVSADNLEVVQALGTQLDEMNKGRPLQESAGAATAMTEDDIRRLQALGYVASGDADDVWDGAKNTADPKDLIALHENDSKLISLITLKEYVEAAALCRAMLAERPEYWRGHLHLARIAAEQNRLAEAVDEFRQALAMNPAYAPARVLLGKALAAMGQHEAAVDELTRALADDPASADGHRELADTLARLGRTEDAITHYRAALTLSPRDAETQLNLGIALASMRRFDEAATCYREALAIEPDNVKAMSNLGKALQLLGRHAEAIAQYRSALERAPGSVQLWCALAETMEGSGDFAGAIASYREAILLDPKSLTALNGVAWILATHRDATIGDPAEAVSFARSAVEICNGQDANVLDTLAAAYAAAGEFEQAVATARQALELAVAASDAALARDIRERLKEYANGQPHCVPPP